MVVADEFMKKNTLITEYIGEVDILAKNEQNSNDSIMDLLRTGYICEILLSYSYFNPIFLRALSFPCLSTRSSHVEIHRPPWSLFRRKLAMSLGI